MGKISRSAWCLRQSVLNPAHYPDLSDMTRLPRTGDTMAFSAYVGTEDRGYDVRVSLDLEEVRDFYRARLEFSDQRLADEIAFLSARLAERMAARRAKKDAA